MSDTKTETVATQFGNVEVETVDCDSCGATIKKEEAKKFVIGEFYETVNTKSTSRVSYRFEEGTANDGWACEFCRDEGPIQMPKAVSKQPDAMTYFLGFVISPLIVHDMLKNANGHEKDRILVSFGGVIMWTATILIAIILLAAP